MCGRFVKATDKDDLHSRFGFEDPLGVVLEPRYNIAPTQLHPVVIVENDMRVCRMMKWGLVPHWAKDPAIGYKMINARAEGIEDKPSFRTPFRKRRCLVIANGFYEWKKVDPKTTFPYLIRLKSGKPFALAGLWEKWAKEPEPIETFTIITTENNELIEPIHNRMPVILHKKNESLWLDPELTDVEKLKNLLKLYPADEMEMYKVSTAVNSPKQDLPEYIEPV